MLQSEFENMTGIYPDKVLYEEIEKAYAEELWSDKRDFCVAYSNNVNGLAQVIQLNVNEKLWKHEDNHRRAMDNNAKRISNLYNDWMDADNRCKELEEQLAIKENALTLETITNKDAVKLMIAGVESDLRNYCTSISEGAFYDTYLERVKIRITQYEELQALLNNME